MSSIEPVTLDIPDSALADLHRRLDATRWPEREPVADWSQGAPLERVQALCAYWRHTYDWRRCEAMLNSWGQFRTTIDGLGIHFAHVRSPHAHAVPLLLTHGWPGSIIEFHKVIGPLTDPVAHGGDVRDAFHLVMPCIPGYGFSDKPDETGWGVERIARAWVELMKRLGYERFVAQGGDWGALVTSTIGEQRPPECMAIHVNMLISFPDQPDMSDLSETEVRGLEALQFYQTRDNGYAKQQGTRPQTLGYGLTDSPAGQAAWILDKFFAWTDAGGDPANVLSYDELLDNIMLYWLTATATSSARLYWESMDGPFNTQKVDIPAGCSVFPREIFRPSRRWAERNYSNLVFWKEHARGGHFAALEQPALLVQDIRDCFRPFR